MIYYLNKCPNCNQHSSFTPEQLECDSAIIANCNHCGFYLSQTYTLKTFEKWWSRFETDESQIKPFISKEHINQLRQIENEIRSYSPLELVEIHFKDFTDYHMSED